MHTGSTLYWITTLSSGAMGAWHLPSVSVSLLLDLRQVVHLNGQVGSLFNHNQSPNVSFSLDPSTESIRYTTTRDICSDEELCIFYGHKLWFEDVNAATNATSATSEPDDPWGGLGAVSDPDLAADESEEEDGDLAAPVAEDDLPFVRVRITPDEEEEEDMESIRTGERPCRFCRT